MSHMHAIAAATMASTIVMMMMMIMVMSVAAKETTAKCCCCYCNNESKIKPFSSATIICWLKHYGKSFIWAGAEKMEPSKVSSFFALLLCVRCDWNGFVNSENDKGRKCESPGMQNKCQQIRRLQPVQWREMNFIQMADFDAIVNCCEWHVRVYDLGIHAFYYAIAHAHTHTHAFHLIRFSVLRFMLCFLVCFLNVLCVRVLFYLFIPSMANVVFFVYHTQSHNIINDRCLVIAKRWAENNDFSSVVVEVVVVVVVVIIVVVITIVRGGVAFQPNDTYTHTHT